MQLALVEMRETGERSRMLRVPCRQKGVRWRRRVSQSAGSLSVVGTAEVS